MAKEFFNRVDLATEKRFYKLFEKFSGSQELTKIKWAYEEHKESDDETNFIDIDSLENALNLYGELETSILVAYEKVGTINEYNIEKYENLNCGLEFEHNSDDNTAVKCESYNIHDLIEELENRGVAGHPDDIRTAVASNGTGSHGYIVNKINDTYDGSSAGLELVTCKSTLERDIEYNNIVLGDSSFNHYYIKKFKDLNDKDIDILFKKHL